MCKLVATRSYILTGHCRSLLSMLVVVIVVFAATNGQRSFNCSFEPTCRCISISKHNYKANCTSLNLDHFPAFSENVSEIDMSHNHLTRISADTHLPSYIKWLDISDCSLRSIEKGFIRKLKHLEYLDISHNRELTLEVLPNVTHDLQFTKIKVLKLNALQCKSGNGITLKRRHLCDLKNTSLVALFLSSNRIEMVERGMISNLPKTLENFTAADNRFTLSWYIIDVAHLKNLKFVDLSSQYKPIEKYFTYFESDCYDNRQIRSEIDDVEDQSCNEDPVPVDGNITYGTCMLEYVIKHYSLPTNGHTRFTYFCIPPSIETIILSHCSIEKTNILPNSFFDFRNIKAYYLNDNMRTVLRGEIFSNKTSHLDYSNNFLSDIHPSFFKPTNLTYLNLSRNYLGNQLRQENSSHLLQEQTYLTTLDLAGNSIQRLPHGFFDPFVRLERLDLSHNEFDDINFRLKSLLSLKQLNLSKNRLKMFSRTTMNELDTISPGQLMIDLSKNDIFCSCHSLDFLKWILQHSKRSKIIFKELKTYSCTFSNSTRSNFSELPDTIARLNKECASYIGIIIASVITVTALLISVCGGVIYRYRWRIRYFYYMAKRSYRGNARSRNGHYRHMFHFDAFISYSSDDRKIALHDFRLNVEENHGLRLCFHERDFIPGFDIAENISNAIHDSRKVICILSDSFLTSSWCMYEFNFALMERIHRPDAENMLFLVRLKNFNPEKAPRSILQFIRDTTYATDDFPEDVSSQYTFWTHIADTISMD